MDMCTVGCEAGVVGEFVDELVEAVEEVGLDGLILEVGVHVDDLGNLALRLQDVLVEEREGLLDEVDAAELVLLLQCLGQLQDGHPRVGVGMAYKS